MAIFSSFLNLWKVSTFSSPKGASAITHALKELGGGRMGAGVLNYGSIYAVCGIVFGAIGAKVHEELKQRSNELTKKEIMEKCPL